MPDISASERLESNLFFTRLVAYTGGSLIGYKKGKSLARIGFSEEFEWNRDFFGPDSSLFEYNLNTTIGQGYLSELLLPGKGEPVHHRYMLTPEGMDLFLKSPVCPEKEEIMTEILIWATLPAKYSVSYVLQEYHPQKERVVSGDRIIDSYPLMSKNRIDKLIRLYQIWKINGYSAIALEKTANSYSLKIDPAFSERYSYLRQFTPQGIDSDFLEIKPLLSAENPIIHQLQERNLVNRQNIMDTYEEMKERLKTYCSKWSELINTELGRIKEFYDEVNRSQLMIDFEPPYVKLKIPDEGITMGQEVQIRHALQVSELLSVMELRTPRETLSLLW